MDEMSTTALTEPPARLTFHPSSGRRNPSLDGRPRPLVPRSARPMDEILPEDDVDGGTEIGVGFARREVPEARAENARLAAARSAPPRPTPGEPPGAVRRREGDPRRVAVGIAQKHVPSKSRRVLGHSRRWGVTARFLHLLQLLRLLLVLNVYRLDVADVDSGEVEGLEDGSAGR